MESKERVIYILKIIVLFCIIFWLLFSDKEEYVEDYNAKIIALEQKVDSLHHINDELTFKIDTLNGQITKLLVYPLHRTNSNIYSSFTSNMNL